MHEFCKEKLVVGRVQGVSNTQLIFVAFNEIPIPFRLIFLSAFALLCS